MSKIVRNLVLATFGLAILGQAGSVLAQSEENAIKYRQATMKALGGHMSAAAAIVGGKAGSATHLPAHIAAISDISLMVKDLFPEGSDFGETTALPKIWSDAAGFSKEVKVFEMAVADFAKTAKSGDMAVIGTALGGVGKACKSCHETFREKKK